MTDHTTEELLPCPFCGCRVPPTMQGNGIGDNWLECTECGASTKLREDGAGSEKDWNRRAAPTPSTPAPVACPQCGGSQQTWKCDCVPMWAGYATPPTRPDVGEARDAARYREARLNAYLFGVSDPTPEQFDAAVDASLLASTPTPQDQVIAGKMARVDA
jgi:hypothetical protein